MAISMYQVSIPVFVKTLGNLAAILDQGAAFAAAKKVDPSVLLNWRLAPDMLNLTRQVQIAADHAKRAPARKTTAKRASARKAPARKAAARR